MATILLIAADDLLRGSLEDQLARHGFTVAVARDARDGGELAAKADLVLIDAGLHDPPPQEMLSALARLGAPPSIGLGRVEGADLCLDKPFRFADLLNGIESLLKPAPGPARNLGGLLFYPASRLLEDEQGRCMRLTEKEAAILDYLSQAGDRVVSRNELLGSVWGYAGNADTHTVETHIYRLRRKLGETSLLLTENGGYRLAAS